MLTTLSKTYLFLLFFGISLFSAQSRYTEKQIDSLLRSNEKSKNWSQKENVDFLTKMFKESEKMHYESGQIRSLSALSGFYMQKGQYDKAIKYFEKIEKFNSRNSDNSYYIAKALTNKSFAYLNLGCYKDAQVALDKSKQALENSCGEDYYALKGRINEVQAALFIELQKPEKKILHYLKQAESNYIKVQEAYRRDYALQGVYCNIITSYETLNRQDSAFYYIKKIVKMGHMYNSYAPYVYDRLGNQYEAIKHWDSAIINYKKSAVASERVKDPLTLKSSYHNLSRVYEKIKDKDSSLYYNKKYSGLLDSLELVSKKGSAVAAQKIKEDIQKESESVKKYLYWIIGGIISVLLFISWYLIKKYNKEKKARLEKKEIIQQKDFELNDLKSKVNDSFEEVVLLAKNNDPAFLGRFKEVYPDFCNKLQQVCPDILNSELIFCAYLKLNFSTKDIATYTFVTPKAVYNRKNRIRKRLNIPSDEDIYLWMNKI